jgi:hypothetical protein
LEREEGEDGRRGGVEGEEEGWKAVAGWTTVSNEDGSIEN